ncbi:hypothetical protein [Halobellus rubicundus]|uniref:Uncharacterized protein n=1 Tax=Halobellus rubicundus TaxID=2996466 RepID=A0ABD5M811_9EURY
MDYLDNPEFDINELLEETGQRQQQRLEKELERIEQQLEERDEIHREIVDELESKLSWYTDRLESLYKQRTGKTGERQELKNQISSFYRQLREEKQQHWHDKQKLEQERRELLRKLEEASDTELFDEFLSL